MAEGDTNGSTPTVEDLTAYSLENNITYPMLIDINWMEQQRFSVDSGIPSWSLFGRGPVVEITDGVVTEQDIIDLL